MHLVFLTLALVFINLAIYHERSANSMRNDLIAVLPAVSIVFALAGAIVLALFSSSVSRLHNESFMQARRVKEAAWRAYEALMASDSDVAHYIANHYVLDVAETSLSNLRDTLFDWEDMEEHGVALLNEEPTLVSKYLLSLEDEINEMGILIVHRVVINIHRKLIWTTFGLVAASIAILGLEATLPQILILDLVVANLAAMVLVYAPIQLLVATTWLDQEVREHGYEPEETREDAESTDAA